MFKRALTLLLLAMTVVSFARTKDEINKELGPLNRKVWTFPYSKEYKKYETEIMQKDAAYVEAQKAEAVAVAARSAYFDTEMSKTPEGKALVDARVAADKALAAADEASKVAAAAEQRKAAGTCSAYIRTNKLMNWGNPEFRKLEMDFRAKNRARINAGVEAMLKSDNAEAKAFAQDYKDTVAKIAQLREELKTAE